MKYNYNIETIAHNSIEIERPENCCLKCTYVDGTYSYLVIVTTLGTTEVITYDKMNRTSRIMPKKSTISTNSLSQTLIKWIQ